MMYAVHFGILKKFFLSNLHIVPTVAAPYYITTIIVRGFQFLHMHVKIYL